MRQVVVLGSGMVGSVIAADLAQEEGFAVTVVDRSEAALESARERVGEGLRTIQADLSDTAEIARLAAPADAVVGALASHLGHAALRTVIEAGKPYCDISFMPERALDFDALAKEKGVTAVVDCGVAPGLSHMMAGYGAARLDEAQELEIYVGGLPCERRWPFEYKAGFAPHDVIEEYTREARLVEGGEVVVRAALSEPELLDFPGIGTLEAFNTDGLRSLVETLEVPTMKEKTLRYPGHIELMRVFREIGLFSKEEIEVGGVKVRPLDVFSTLVFPSWSYDPGEPDLTVMRVAVEGLLEGRQRRLAWDLFDAYDEDSAATSMSRTTGFPCAIVTRLLLDGRLDRPGVLCPEHLGADETLFCLVLEGLQERGVRVLERDSGVA